MFASTTQSGQFMGTPDTCKTPAPPSPSPVPMPYPNTAQCMMANPGTAAMKVKIVMMSALTKKSEIPMSNGDEAGVAGGVVSNMNMGACKYMMGSAKVKIEGNPVVKMGDTTGQNGNNANVPAGNQIAPSQTKVMIMG
jgi:uncharacterized Zn-binding protein involved in type VI secretion